MKIKLLQKKKYLLKLNVIRNGVVPCAPYGHTSHRKTVKNKTRQPANGVKRGKKAICHRYLLTVTGDAIF